MLNYVEAIFTVEPEDPGRDILVAELADAGFESFEPVPGGLMAYVRAEEFDPEPIEEMIARYEGVLAVTFHHKAVEPVNWNEEWEKNYPPVVIGERCGIRAPFHPPIEGLEYDIVIEPKMSFGTAHHDTTALMIGWLLDMDIEGLDVLDMGCGTGVLAILAAMKNAGHIVAIDNYIWAYTNTMENAARNGAPHIIAMHGDAGALKGMDERFDLILANINRNVLLEDLEVYALKLKPAGKILLSGFFSGDEQVLDGKAAESGLTKVSSRVKNNWSSILYRR